ncbi:MAG: M20 family metallopeptidase, partial [Acidimicrobiales bacterium]
MSAQEQITKAVDGARDALVRLSHDLHGYAEIAFEEHRSARRVAEILADHGFTVDDRACDLDTAFVATAGSGDLTIGICAEYDALPGIGHACGHNIIAATAVGAGVALADVADDLGVTVKVLGTPAEEGGGGKILMLERGGFDGLNAAMMVHPAPFDNAVFPTLAVQHIDVSFHGRSAHASAYPEKGVNAADALTVAQVAIGLLRQHIRPTDRLHGIVTDGGDAPNIVPERTSGLWYVRAATLAQLDELLPRARACFEAGALATGATVEFHDVGPPYSEFDHDLDMAAIYRRHAEALGRSFELDGDPVLERLAGSTDMANVSLAMPTIHPMISIE